jgi:hypothetical protein
VLIEVRGGRVIGPGQHRNRPHQTAGGAIGQPEYDAGRRLTLRARSSGGICTASSTGTRSWPASGATEEPGIFRGTAALRVDGNRWLFRVQASWIDQPSAPQIRAIVGG